ncbi:MAG TPA: hypothetical protein VJO15_09555, partial [Dehalococcoidia bacterium]|nr:hypothetical protein [Dehalococcoidia bacterium]
GLRPNYGLELKGSDGTNEPWSRTFAGRGSGSKAPRLVILRAPEGTAGAETLVEAGSAGRSAAALPPISRPDLCPLGKFQVVAPDLIQLPGFPTNPYPQRRQWPTIYPMVTVTGTATRTSVSHTDYAPDHNDHDFVFHVATNAGNAQYMGADNPNDMEIEWEQSALSMWAWPTEGDDVLVFGPLIYDCGHGAGKSEVHPPRGLVSIRQGVATDITGRDSGLGTVLLNRADIFFSSQRTPAYCGGWCEHGEPSYVPVNDQDYKFDLPLPTNGAPGAKPVVWLEFPDPNVSLASATGVHRVDPVTEVVTVGGVPHHISVTLPYKTLHDYASKGPIPLYTAAQVFYGWSRTTDPPLRAFKVQVHGIDIYDNSDKSDGEWYVWVDINGQWFNLRRYYPGIDHDAIGDAGDQYYATTKDLVSQVIVPDTSKGRIRVRAVGYEADCIDDHLGEPNFVPKLNWNEVAPYAGSTLGFALTFNLFDPMLWKGLYIGLCMADENDTIQNFDETFDKASKPTAFGGGVIQKKFNAKGGDDGKYGLVLSIIEELAPPQYAFRSMKVAAVEPGNTYRDSDEISFALNYGTVKATAAYDQDALWIKMYDIPATQFDGESQQAAIYLDAGSPSLPWASREDDLRISFRSKPTEALSVSSYDPITGWYTKPVASGLVTVTSIVNTYPTGISWWLEFRVDKSLIPRGPWSKTLSTESIFNDGIGGLLAIERADQPRRGAWPETALSTDPRSWARMLFLPGCAVTLELDRLTPLWTENVGETGLVRVRYRVSDVPACDLRTGTLRVDVTNQSVPPYSPYWEPLALKDINTGLPSVGGGGVYQNGAITWSLPAQAKEVSFSLYVKQGVKCSQWPPLLSAGLFAAVLNTGFDNLSIPPLARSASAQMCAPPNLDTPVNPPNVRMAPEGWGLGPRPPWFGVIGPLRAGDPPEVLVNLRSADNYARRVVVKAMAVPAGVSSGDPAGNATMDFSKATGVWYTVPANGEITVRTAVELAVRGVAQAGGDDLGAVAVELSYPDTWEPSRSSVRQVVPHVSLAPGSTGVFTATVRNTVRVPSRPRLDAVTHCPGWAADVVPSVLPAQVPGASATVQVRLLPPAGAALGSGCPTDVVAWTEAGEYAGSQRILDLPPLQASLDQPQFASGEIVLEPAEPKLGEQARACAVVRNPSSTTVEAAVLLGMGDGLSTAPLISNFSSVPLQVPAGGIGRACGPSFTWAGDRSFKAIIRQAGYQDQTIQRHVASVAVPQPGSSISGLLEVRNPLAATAALS